MNEIENNEEARRAYRNTVEGELEIARTIEKIYRATLEYFRQDTKAQKYFAGLEPRSVKWAIEHYAHHKAKWLVNGENEEYWYNYFLLQSKGKAEKSLPNILQKKLFDKQCEWRAGIFDHPLIETTYDFYYWERNILNCPFIEPITKEDVDLYIDYLKDYLGAHLSFLASWQDYDTYCTNKVTVASCAAEHQTRNSAEEEDEEDDLEEEAHERLMPPWYLFWEARRGGSHHRLLPDKRSSKEWEYVRIARAHKKQQQGEVAKVFTPPLPSLSLSILKKGEIDSFINEYESPAGREKILKAFRIYMKTHWEKEGHEIIQQTREAWFELEDCVESFPMADGGGDWKQALIVTARQWEHHKIARELPIVHEEYLFRLQNGITQPFDEKHAGHYRRMADEQKEEVLLGRELKGK